MTCHLGLLTVNVVPNSVLPVDSARRLQADNSFPLLHAETHYDLILSYQSGLWNVQKTGPPSAEALG
jgi:hypothetical protein